MIIWFSLLASIIPMSFYLLFIRNMDRFEKEPLLLVLKHFIWGATGAVFFAIIGSTFLSFPVKMFFTDVSLSELLMTVLVAPLVEESAKGIYLLRTVKRLEFDNITDGLVYGGAIGLGFGMTENFLYFIGASDNLSNWIATVVIRTTFSAVMHAIATATFGAFLAMKKFSTNKFRNAFPIIGILIAMFIHFLWNFTVSFTFTSLLGYLFLLTAIISFFLVFKLSLKNEAQIIQTELKSENIPLKISTKILSLIKSKKKKIEQSENKEYISLAVKLAFRKRQLATATGKDIKIYSDDIFLIRNELNNKLNIINSKDNNEQ